MSCAHVRLQTLPKVPPIPTSSQSPTSPASFPICSFSCTHCHFPGLHCPLEDVPLRVPLSTLLQFSLCLLVIEPLRVCWAHGCPGECPSPPPFAAMVAWDHVAAMSNQRNEVGLAMLPSSLLKVGSYWCHGVTQQTWTPPALFFCLLGISVHKCLLAGLPGCSLTLYFLIGGIRRGSPRLQS